jgi:hypothetical protein
MAEDIVGEKVLNMDPAAPPAEKVFRAADPAISNVATPGDFAAEFPNPLDPTEVLDLCEDLGVWSAIPEEKTGLKTYTWREMTSLAFTSGTQYIAFTDGACPEEYAHDGSNESVDLKNLGAKKSLTVSDIMHSAASIGAGYGISALLGGYAASSGMPGGQDAATFVKDQIADLKAKEVRLGMTLVLNGWDDMLVNGSTAVSALEFNGIVQQVTAANGAHVSSGTVSGSFNANAFDQFLAASCAKPTDIFGHPAAIQGLMSAYFQVQYQGSQVVQYTDGARLVPGINFAGFVNTGVGRLAVHADTRFPRTSNGTGGFSSVIYALRMQHNGEPLVYKITQIPLSLRDLVPGCTAISFEIWVKTALIIKSMCAQGAYPAIFDGPIATTCTIIG